MGVQYSGRRGRRNGGGPAVDERPVVWLRGGIKTPPFTVAGRREAGALLRALQEGEAIGMPRAKPMPGIGPRCLELRVRDGDHNWRVVVRVDPDAVVVVDIFAKRTVATPKAVIAACRRRLARYDQGDAGEA